MIRKYLSDAYAEICSLVGDNKLPSNWKDFSVYLSEKWICMISRTYPS